MKLLKQPLLHFLALGALVFVVFDLAAPGNPADEVVISEADIAAMKLLWQAQWRIPPTAQELKQLTATRIREEIYYREALAQGLNVGDGVVRRRLAQKLENQINDLALLDEPTPDALQQFFLTNIAQYRNPPDITFEHRFFNNDLRGDDARRDANRAMARLNQGQAVQGDQFAGPMRTRASMPALSTTFGNSFSNELLALAETGSTVWQGPVSSAFGQHVVKIERYEPAASKNLSEVTDEVTAEWRRERIEKVQEDAYEKMKQRYRVAVAPLE